MLPIAINRNRDNDTIGEVFNSAVGGEEIVGDDKVSAFFGASRGEPVVPARDVNWTKSGMEPSERTSLGADISAV